MTDHHNALPAGYRLGEYEIQTVLGSGGFGITYKARDCNLGKSVAIKEYLPADFAVRDGRTTVKPKSNASKDDYDWGLNRFLDEARTLARFDHPHINKVLRYFQDNGTAYLVLEYIEGDMLSDLLKRKGRFNTVGLRRMLDELLDGLDAVHSAGYIHRDIKPANIIFRRDGSAVLLDFGAARQAIGKRSQTITSILTPGYAPVEQYLNTIDAMGAWSDLYSLGVVAYRCLVGGDESVLIDAPSRAHLVQRGEVEKDMPAAVKVGADNYPMSLLRAIDWAMKVDERERPQSVAEMRAVLAGGDEVAQSVEPTPSVRVKKKGVKRIASLLKMLQSRRRMLGRTLGGIGAVVLVVVVVFSIAQYEQWQVDKVAEAVRVAEVKRVAEVEAERQRIAAAEAAVEAERQRKIAEAEAAVEAERQRKIAAAKAERQRKNAELARIFGSDLHAFRRKIGRDPSVRQVDDGTTDLHIAAANGWVKVTQWLIDNGANVNARDYSREMPLHKAMRHFDVAKLLLANGAIVNAKDSLGWTPLHRAAFSNAVDVAKLLRANGADVYAKTERGGYTPLHWAAYTNAFEVAEFLLANGANVHAQSDFGDTPVDKAIEQGQSDMVTLLEQHGGRCNKECY